MRSRGRWRRGATRKARAHRPRAPCRDATRAAAARSRAAPAWPSYAHLRRACLGGERARPAQQWVQILRDELPYLRRRATRVQRRLELGAERVTGHLPERRIAAKAVEQVVRCAG